MRLDILERRLIKKEIQEAVGFAYMKIRLDPLMKTPTFVLTARKYSYITLHHDNGRYLKLTSAGKKFLKRYIGNIYHMRNKNVDTK